MNRFSQFFERTMQRRYWSRRQFFRSFAVLWVLLMLNFIFLTCIAGAQTNSATLSGTVLDGQGAVVPDVAITISSRATGLKRQTMSSTVRISVCRTSISTAPRSLQSVKHRMLLPAIRGSAKVVLASFNLV